MRCRGVLENCDENSGGGVDAEGGEDCGDTGRGTNCVEEVFSCPGSIILLSASIGTLLRFAG